MFKKLKSLFGKKLKPHYLQPIGSIYVAPGGKKMIVGKKYKYFADFVNVGEAIFVGSNHYGIYFFVNNKPGNFMESDLYKGHIGFGLSNDCDCWE